MRWRRVLFMSRHVTKTSPFRARSCREHPKVPNKPRLKSRDTHKDFLIFGLVFVALLFARNAEAAAGVSPAYYEVNFQPGFEQEFVFDFRPSNPNVESEVYAEGELAQYVDITPRRFIGAGRVNVHLELPRAISEPGPHIIAIGAKEIYDEVGGIVLVGDVRGLIIVRVPYPGKYAELDFSASNANAGEKVEFAFRIYSRGQEEIITNSKIEIYDLNGNLMEVLNLGDDRIQSGQFVDVNVKLDTARYGAGNYKAVAVVSHDGRTVKKDADFRLGELFVDIVDYSVEVDRNTIDSVIVELESFWNDPIENVFVRGEVLGYDIEFQTPSVILQPWSKSRVTGHFDTTQIEEKTFQTKLTAVYGNKTTEKIVQMRFVRKVNYLLIGLIAALVVALAFFVWMIVDFVRLKKHGKK